jgi:hypothetical protein
MKIFKLSLIVITFLLLISCSEKSNSFKAEGIEKISSSKTEDFFAMIKVKYLWAIKAILKGDTAALDNSDVQRIVDEYYNALRKKNFMTIDALISNNFISYKVGKKNDYINYQRDLQHNAFYLKLKPEIEGISLYGKNALVQVKLKTVLCYPNSGTIWEETGTKEFLWVGKSGWKTKIIQITTERKYPLGNIEEGYFEDKHLFCKFKLPDNYVYIKSDNTESANTIDLYNRNEPLEIHLNVVWIDTKRSKVSSALWMLDNDLKFLSRNRGFKLQSKEKYLIKDYDAGLIDFSYYGNDAGMRDRRVYIWREPLMYVINLYGENDDKFENEIKKYENLVASFTFIPVIGKLRDSLRDVNDTSAPLLTKNNFYNYEVASPEKWERVWYSSDRVQFLKKDKSGQGIASFAAREISEPVDLKAIAEHEKDLMGAAFDYNNVTSVGTKTINELPAYEIESEFKAKMFDKYNHKKEIYFYKKPYLYRFTLSSQGWDPAIGNEAYEKYLEGIKIGSN